jgi:Transposase, Mutator family
MLVLMGATAEGKKELLGFQTGMRESGQSWKELLVDLKARGLVVAPQVAIGDGALERDARLDDGQGRAPVQERRQAGETRARRFLTPLALGGAS